MLSKFSIKGQAPSYVPTAGLVGRWPFNGNAKDQTQNANDGKINGASLTTDRQGNANSAYSFDASNSNNIQITNSSSLNISVEISISAWFRTFTSGSITAILGMGGP
ncbi:MAG: hypothetical protein SGJ10_05575 [Bacteroidota bacterium]|nr:hypothetical protein [Bacteroidota bacterium]